MKKIVVFFVCIWLIATIVLPVLGVNIYTDQKYTLSSDSYRLEIGIDANNLNDIVDLSGVYEIYEGENFILVITAYWIPHNATKTICLWVDNSTMPVGATFTPPCNCALGEVTSIFEWTPAVGQAGIYEIIFYIGTNCSSYQGLFIEKIIVLSSGQDNPPLVFIQSPENGTTFNSPNITVTGYATDDIGLYSIGYHHEWIDDETMISGTIPNTTYYPFMRDFKLHEGWNRITIFVSDIKNHLGEDQIVVYYEISTNQPPNKPLINGPNTGKPGRIYSCSFIALDPEDDNIFYEIDWGNGIVIPWDGPIKSNEKISRTHVYLYEGNFTIMARAKDIYGNIGEWGTFTVTMPKSKAINTLLFSQRFFQCFPFFEKILNQYYN